MANKAQPWTNEEIVLLTNTYPTATKEELINLFPNRTHKSIAGKAEKMGLHKLEQVEEWMDSELDILVANYSIIPKEDMILLLPNRTWSSIQHKASRLNLRKYNKYKDERTVWTDQEIEITVSDKGFKLLNINRDKNRINITVSCVDEHTRTSHLDGFLKWVGCPVCTGRYKKPYEEAKTTIEKEGYVVLTTESHYKNARTKLDTICPQGHSYPTTLSNFNHGNRCSQCYFEIIGQSNFHDIGYVKLKYQENNFIVQDNQVYKGVDEKLECKCIHHLDRESLYLSYIQVVNQKVNCPYCVEDEKVNNYKTIYNQILCTFNNFNLQLLTSEEEYVKIRLNDKNSYIKFTCKEHINKGTQKIKIRTIRNDHDGSYCKYCVSVSGENHYRWQGGISNLSEYLRGRIQPWKDDSFKAHNYTCDVSGKDRNLTIHHKYAFSNIVKETLAELNFPVHKNINKYSDEQITLIEEKCLDIHYRYGLGICLNVEIHELFHSIYSVFNFTPEDYDEFKIRYKNGEFKEVC
jgi:hypothetical protein